jgi:hypothetical protein
MITQIWCARSGRSNRHGLGCVEADPDGLVLTYQSVVHTTPDDPDSVCSKHDGYYYQKYGSEMKLRRPQDEILEIDLWCSACRMGHPVSAGAIFDAAQRRQPNVTLTSRGKWEAIWNWR